MARSKTASRSRPASAPPAARAPRTSPIAWLAAHPWAVAAALGALHLVFALLALNPTPHVGGDNGAYVSLARSLLERGAYVDLWDPSLKPHTQYPPVFAGILAVAMTLGLKPWVGLKLVVVAFSVLAVAVSYLWLRRRTTPGVALAVGATLALLPGTLNLSHWVLSDVPFWAFTMLALWGFAHLARGAEADGGGTDAAEGERHAARWAAVAIAATVLAYFTRSAGVPLVVAAVAWLALHRRWRTLGALAAAAGLPAFLWWLRGRSVQAPGYLSQFWAVDPYAPSAGSIGPLGLIPRAWVNLRRYEEIHLPNVLAGGVGWVPTAVAVAVTGLALVGWVRRLRRPGVGEIFFVLYSGLVLVWPATWSGERFLLPILPLLLTYAAESVRDVGTRVKAPGVVAGVALGVLAVPIARGVSAEIGRGASCRAQFAAGSRFPCMGEVWRDLFGMSEALRGRLPNDAVVISRKPTLTFVLSGYRSRLYPMTARPDSFFAAAREAGAEWVIIDQVPDMAPMYLHPVLLAARDDFCVVREPIFPEAVLARIDTAGPPRPPGSPPNSFRLCDLPPPEVAVPGLAPAAAQPTTPPQPAPAGAP